MLSVSPEMLVETRVPTFPRNQECGWKTMVSLHCVMLSLRLPIHVRPSALSSIDGSISLSCNLQCNLHIPVPDFAQARLQNAPCLAFRILEVCMLLQLQSLDGQNLTFPSLRKALLPWSFSCGYIATNEEPNA
jgi:hypothetical protein